MTREKEIEKLEDVNEIRTILSSRILRRILQESRKRQQEKVNEFVMAQDLISAYGHRCKLEYIDKFGPMVEREYEKLTKKEKK